MKSNKQLNGNKLEKLAKDIGADKRMLALFLYWIIERWSVYRKRTAGEPKPWTQDEVLQSWFFTMPHREYDKTTIWFRENLRDPLDSLSSSDSPRKMDTILKNVGSRPGFKGEVLTTARDLLWATIAFRWFNFIPTGQVLMGTHFYTRTKCLIPFDSDDGVEHLLSEPTQKLIPTAARIAKQKATVSIQAIKAGLNNLWLVDNFNPDEIARRLKFAPKIVTGGFMIKTYNGMDKVSGILKALENVHQDYDNLLERVMERSYSLEKIWECLTPYPFLGPFMAYEIVTDLRWTFHGRNANDINSWCNLGPGGMRGFNRMFGHDLEATMPRDWPARMVQLLSAVQLLLDEHNADTARGAYSSTKGFSNKAFSVVPTSPKEWDAVKRDQNDLIMGGIIPPVEMREIEHSLCEFDKYMRALEGDGKMKRTYDGLGHRT
jgi:hypothetical protein